MWWNAHNYRGGLAEEEKEKLKRKRNKPKIVTKALLFEDQFTLLYPKYILLFNNA